MNYKQMLDKFAELERRLKELEERVDFVEHTRDTTIPIQPFTPPYDPWERKSFSWRECPKCKLRLDQGPMGYVCSQPQCPTGLGGSWCSTNDLT